MKFVSIRDLRLKPGEVWKMTKVEKGLVITSNGRPIAILTGVNGETFEDELDVIQRARALKALDNLHKESVMKRTHFSSDKEIQAEFEAIRKGKQR